MAVPKFNNILQMVDQLVVHFKSNTPSALPNMGGGVPVGVPFQVQAACARPNIGGMVGVPSSDGALP